MNLAEELEALEPEVEEKEEEQEIEISARLVWTDEQEALDAEGTVNLTISGDFAKKPTVDYDKLPELNPVVPQLMFTQEQKSDLLEAFNLLDHTGEGKIKAEDFRVAIKALGYEPTKEELQNMVNAVDKGSTGKLSFENFQTAIMRKVMAKDTDGDIMKSFRLFDNDDNGLISFENVKRVSEILGANLTDEEIEEMLDDADKDLDGFINVQDFMKMIKNCVHIVTP